MAEFKGSGTPNSTMVGFLGDRYFDTEAGIWWERKRGDVFSLSGWVQDGDEDN